MTQKSRSPRLLYEQNELWARGLDPANDENYREREERPDAQMEACIIANSKDIYIVNL